MSLKVLVNGNGGRREVPADLVKANARSAWVRIGGRIVKRKVGRDIAADAYFGAVIERCGDAAKKAAAGLKRFAMACDRLTREGLLPEVSQ